MKNNKIIAVFIGLVFFIVALVTLPHYGINWDTINHLPRGQAYLNYYLTGKHDYSNLSNWKLYWQKPESLGVDTNIIENDISGRSFYQSDASTFDWYMEQDGVGHPPLSDILSSVFNRILFGKLHLINDIDSYRVYGVLLAAISVGLVYFWVSSVYGSFAGLVSAIALASYPLFWAESHFNTEKDIPETAFWILFMFSFWKGTVEKKWKWLLAAGLFFGLALGTKFNILFSVFIIIPWFLFYLLFNRITFSLTKLKKFLADKKLLMSLVAIPIIGLVVLIMTWPYLWPDIFDRLSRVMGFYKEIGLTANINTRFLGPFQTNTFPLLWITYTTPIITLILSIVGILAVLLKLIFEKNKTSSLFLLWFTVPVIRAIWPGMTIYGGIRQIMEYIPAMAILAGLGAKQLIDIFKFKYARIILISLVFLCFLLQIINLSIIHPNENVYFNSLIGGLSGAKEKNIPFWGFSFGSPYRQAVVWINQNAEKGANIVYTYDLMPNFPRIWLRSDLNLSNAKRSGYLQEGEYAMGLVYNGTEQRSYYDSYLEKFIEPVYEVKVDDVAILKIWKNDEKHLKIPWREILADDVSFRKTDLGLRFDLGENKSLSRLEILYDENRCNSLDYGYTKISEDELVWNRLPGVLVKEWKIPVLGQQPKDGKFIEAFVGQNVRYVDLELTPSDTCLTKIKNFKFYVFANRILE